MAEKMTKIGEGNSRLAVITPSLLCNYNCPYCRIKKKERGDYEYTLREWFDALVRAGAPVAHVAGGEPTVLRGFEEFVVKYPSPVRMTTNLWKHPSMWSPEFWRKFEYITLSFHPSHTSFEKFSEKVAYLADFFQKAGEGPEMACTIVAYPEYLDSIKDWIARLTELGVKARGQYYNSPANDATKTYTRDELERLKDLSIPMSAQVAGQEVYAERTLKECNAGMYYTHIDMRGNARRCSRDRMSLGNIFDGSFKWFGEHQQCQTACTEACDMAFARYKILEVVNREERNSREEACMGAQSAKDKCNGINGGDSDTRPPLHNLEYQKKALERFAMFCSHKGKDILEIGSDPDLRVIQYLGERARSVFGITNAREHWKYSESGKIIVSGNVFAANYDARSMPFDDSSFDTILSIATFEHIIGLEDALDEMYRVLRPGGVIYSSFGPIWSCAVGHHIHLNTGDRYFRFWRDDLNPIPHYYHLLYEEEELAAMLTDKYGEALARTIAEQVYHAGHINRLMYSDYIRIFRQSRFHVGRIEDRVIRELSTEVRERLTDLYGGDNHYECGTIETVLYKPRITARRIRKENKEYGAAGGNPPPVREEEVLLSSAGTASPAGITSLRHAEPGVYSALCRTFLAAGSTDIPREWIIKAVQEESGLAARIIKRSESLVEKGTPEMALGMLSALVEGDPLNHEAWNDLGAVQLMLLSSAEKSLKKAIALNAGYGNARRNLAALYMLTGRVDLAAEVCAAAVKEQDLPEETRAELENMLRELEPSHG